MSELRCPGCGFVESADYVWEKLPSSNLLCPRCRLVVSSTRQVVVDPFKPLSTVPHRQHTDDAGYDLHANEAMTINVGAIKLVRCGFRIAIPRGVVGLICPRSGMALKRGVTDEEIYNDYWIAKGFDSRELDARLHEAQTQKAAPPKVICTEMGPEPSRFRLLEID